MNKLLRICFWCLFPIHIFAQSVSVALTDTEEFSINSELVSDTFNIQISLPKDYKNSQKEYPIIYLLDSNPSFGITKGVTWWLNFDRLIPEVIIVGIAYNTDWWQKRSRDYTPTKDLAKNWGEWAIAGGADQFIGFISEELNPRLEGYRIDWSNKTIIGHSFGGLFSSYVLLTKPELFENYISISPTVIWNNDFLMTLPLDNLKNQSSQITFFTAIGELDDAKRINEPWEKFNVYIKGSKPDNLAWVDKVYPNQTHSSLIAIAISDGLRMIFEE